MDWKRECAAVVPCLNEAAHIGGVVSRLQPWVEAILVVDDGSTDATAALAAKAGALVVRHETSRGKGAALRSGLLQARELGFAWAACLDGDGQHAPEDLPGFFECAERAKAALVVGDRMWDRKAMPRMRRLTNGFMSWQLSRIAGQPLPDTQCGFRLVRLAAWSALALEADHFEAESEYLLAFAQAGHRIGFVPIQVLYGQERSKIRPWRDTLRWWRWLRHWRKLGGKRAVNWSVAGTSKD